MIEPSRAPSVSPKPASAGDGLMPGNVDLQDSREIREHRVAHGADAVRVGNRDGTAKHAAFLQPRRTREIAEAVAGKPAAEYRLPLLAFGPDDGHAGPHS